MTEIQSKFQCFVSVQRQVTPNGYHNNNGRDMNSPSHNDSDYKYGRFDASALHIAHALKQTEIQKAYNKRREKPIDYYLVSISFIFIFIFEISFDLRPIEINFDKRLCVTQQLKCSREISKLTIWMRQYGRPKSERKEEKTNKKRTEYFEWNNWTIFSLSHSRLDWNKLFLAFRYNSILDSCIWLCDACTSFSRLTRATHTHTRTAPITVNLLCTWYVFIS